MSFLDKVDPGKIQSRSKQVLACEFVPWAGSTSLTSTTMSSREPHFPPELERRIFELSALSHQRVMFSLLQVARRTLIWSVLVLARIFQMTPHNSH
jgi:hypothetical protein